MSSSGSTPLTSERLAEIRADDARMVADLGLRVAYHGDPFEPEGTGTIARRALIDRRDLLAEVDRLRAQVADAWDQGHESAIDGCPCPNPLARDCVNPHRAALASGEQVEPNAGVPALDEPLEWGERLARDEAAYRKRVRSSGEQVQERIKQPSQVVYERQFLPGEQS